MEAIRDAISLVAMTVESKGRRAAEFVPRSRRGERAIVCTCRSPDGGGGVGVGGCKGNTMCGLQLYRL